MDQKYYFNFKPFFVVSMTKKVNNENKNNVNIKSSKNDMKCSNLNSSTSKPNCKLSNIKRNLKRKNVDIINSDVNFDKNKNLKKIKYDTAKDTYKNEKIKNDNLNKENMTINNERKIKNNKKTLKNNLKESDCNGLQKKFQYIINNLSYKETEESLKKYFSTFGRIEKISLQKNKKNIFVGKAVITINKPLKIDNDFILNGKILRVERIKDQMVNDKRIFVSHINKNLSILDIRNMLKENEIKPSDIRIRYDSITKKNNGFCHLTYNNRLEAKKFESKWKYIKEKLGFDSNYEYAYEKPEKFYK